MAGIGEAQTVQGQAAAALAAGLETLTAGQEIDFTGYVRQVLPLDGFVFWVRSTSMKFKGALHYSTNQQQLEDETIGINNVIFTTDEDVSAFNQVSPTFIWVGNYKGLRFAFTQRRAYFQQANLYHYVGDAVYPALSTQLIDDPRQLENYGKIVSNSLPAWLQLASYIPLNVAYTNPKVPVFPSFAVPDNLLPPYIVAHIEPKQTNAVQAFPRYDSTMSQYQLAQDHVRLTTYGLTNDTALELVGLITEYSLETDNFGLMSMIVIRDEKRTQSEMNILAQKKTIEVDVSYYQSKVAAITRQLIKSATIAITIGD